MTNSTVRARLMATSMITGAAIAAVSAGSVLAQAAAAPTQTAENGTAVQEFVVTGSRIPQPNLTSVSPVTSINSANVKLQGVSRVEDLLNNLPQVIGEQGGNLANGATGTATVSLRGLGSTRTLVLVDGRRLVPGDPGDPVPDLNFIPAALIDRVELDTAGASAVYGSDAVAGVVNFIMKRDFEGVQLDVNYGVYQNNNGNSVAQAANIAKGFSPPTGSVWDGNTVDATITIGVNSPDGKGNVEGYVSYRHIDPVTQDKRDYSNCNLNLNTARTGFICAGSGTIPDGQFVIYNQNFTNALDDTLDRANPGDFRPRTGADVFNFAPANYFQRPDERYSGGFFAHYDITPAIQAYSEFMFMDDHTVAQIAPSGIFGSTFNISCTNPLLSAQEVQQICGQFGYTGSNPNVIILKRNVEGGNRQDDLRHTDYRAVIGLKGDLNDAWHYDIYGQYGAAILSEHYLNDVSKERTAKALNVVIDPNTGQPACASFVDGSDLSCVPYNIFTPGGVTQAAVNYLDVPGFQEGQTTEQVVSGSLTGDLSTYGFKSPYAKDGVGIALGAEYRREALNFQPDEEFITGDLAGQGAAIEPVVGAYDVKEVFGEARIPLIEDAPFAKEINLELGYRFSHYSSAGDTNTYKISGEWAITDDIRFRGGFNRAVRAPNVDELFSPQSLGLDGSTDGCAGAVGSNTLVFSEAQCANTGVTADHYGKIAPNPASQYNGIVGGNPNLKPESADTYSVGVVITPHTFVPGFSFSADYFNIKITNVIQGIGADNILDQCAITGQAQFCSLVHRAPNTESLWLGTQGFIVDTVQNLGFLKTSGIDFAANYRTNFHDLGLGEWGGIAIDFLGTYTHDYDIFNGIPGQAPLQCVGKFGLTCQGTGTPLGGPIPHFKASTRLTWSTPLTGFDASLNWRYIGPANLDTGETGCADCRIPAFNYFDLAASYRFMGRYTVRVGVDNIFDRDPPLIGQGELAGVVGSGNTFPQVYDPLGRFIFTSLTADF